VSSFSTGLLAVAVLASLLYTIGTTENPAQIPLRLVFWRAAFGMSLFLLFWFTVCALVHSLLVSIFPVLGTITPLEWCLPVLLGLLLPQSARLVYALPQSAAKHLSFLRRIENETHLYLGRILDREERKASILFFVEDTERRKRALDRLFEEHNLRIAKEEARRTPPSGAALDILKVRHSAVKFKYLIRHLGYQECLRSLRMVAARPQVILPSWPAECGDRRIDGRYGTGKLATERRRKYEQPHIQAWILGVSSGTNIRKKYQFFVSSTYLDLREERQQVLKTLLGCDCIPAGMEFFPSSDEELWTLIRGVVNECDYYLLLVGGRYGSTTTTGISYTEAEYEYAIAKGRPVLAFLHANPASLDSGESPEKQKLLLAFRERICRTHAPGYWNVATELPFLVQQAIEKLKRDRPARGWTRIQESAEH
jgi:Domain of unknown function (DUF4062)